MVMKEIFRNSSPAQVHLLRSLLESEGIPCFIRNETMQQTIPGGLAVAFLPLPDFWPTLCVLRDEDYPKAMELIRSASEAPPESAEDWKCPACGETVPANFASCWNCGGEPGS